MRKLIMTLAGIIIPLSVCFADSNNGRYKYQFHNPIECPDSVDTMIGQRLKGYYNQDKESGEFILVIGYQFQEAYGFDRRNGYARVKKNDLYGFIGLDGAPLFPCIYEYAYDFNEYGEAIVKINGKWGVINDSGHQSIECLYDHIDDLHNHWFEVSRDDNWGYIHISGAYAGSYAEYEKAKRNLDK